MTANKRQREQRDERRTSASDWAKQQGQGFAATAVKLPENVSFWKPAPGVHIVDILEYRVGRGNPRADEGFLHFEREYVTHRIPGPDGKTRPYVCLWERKKGEQQPCPVCQYMNSRDCLEDMRQQLKPQVRHLWNLIELDGKGKRMPDYKLHVYDSNHYNRKIGFGEQICAVLALDDKYSEFARYDEGMSLRLVVEERSLGDRGGKYNAVTRIDFVDRVTPYDDSILDELVCLDDCVVFFEYGELKKVLLMEGDGPEDEDEPDNEPAKAPSRSTTRVEATPPRGEPEPNPAEEKGIARGGFVSHAEHGRCEVLHVSADGTVLKLEDEEGDVHSGVDTDECEPAGKESNGSPADRGTPSGAKKTTQAAPKTADEDDLDDGLEDEKPPPPRKRR